MCLILLAWRAHPTYPLIFAGNRDEAYDRPSVPADFWKDAPDIFGGRDLEKGGTWLGLTRTGRIAAVTNYRDGAAPKTAAPRSRGELTVDFLRGLEEPRAYLDKVVPAAARYGAFSLLVGDLDRFFCFSNRGGGIEELPPGVHGLSNHLLNTPWPKVRNGRQRLSALLEEDEATLRDALFDALADRTAASDRELPDSGVGLQRERELSPAFIAGERYGTRASTVLLVSVTGEAVFAERAFGPMGRPLVPAVDRRFALQVRASGRVTKAAGQDV